MSRHMEWELYTSFSVCVHMVLSTNGVEGSMYVHIHAEAWSLGHVFFSSIILYLDVFERGSLREPGIH